MFSVISFIYTIVYSYAHAKHKSEKREMVPSHEIPHIDDYDDNKLDSVPFADADTSQDFELGEISVKIDDTVDTQDD